MASRYNPIQNAFTAGELSPLLEGRDDLQQYHQGLRQAENALVMQNGGLTRRPGTRFVCEVADSTKRSRLIPFVPEAGDAYVLEFSEGVIRVFKDGAPVERDDCP